MLRREPIIEVEHAGARGGADAPGEIPKERRGSERVGAAVEVKDAAIAARLRHRHVDGIDAAAIDDRCPCARRRTRHERLDALEPAPNRRGGLHPPALPRFEETQRRAQDLGPQADALSRLTVDAHAPARGAKMDVHAAISLVFAALTGKCPPPAGGLLVVWTAN